MRQMNREQFEAAFYDAMDRAVKTDEPCPKTLESAAASIYSKACILSAAALGASGCSFPSLDQIHDAAIAAIEAIERSLEGGAK